LRIIRVLLCLKYLLHAQCPFAVILCPYSLVTYLTGEHDLARLMASVRALLAPDGRFVVDAFVPQAVVADAAFRQDYRRPFGELELVRFKRVTPISPLRNRIERRYELQRPTGEVVERIEVEETIRPYSPPALREALGSGGLVVDTEWWDYGATQAGAPARFFTATATVATS
jgi:hypothetical protein